MSIGKRKSKEPPTKLEKCEPSATREEVIQLITKVATSPKPSHDLPPEQAS